MTQNTRNFTEYPIYSFHKAKQKQKQKHSDERKRNKMEDITAN